MPFYDYECRSCGERFERLIAWSDADDVACPSCDEAHARRLLPVIAGLGGRAEAPAPTCGQGACGNC